jgi:nicotinate-nucleotide adenylyltransferase
VKTGIFSGSFDPPHNGHLALALFGRELLDLDRLIVSVSKNPFKAASPTSDEDRVQMAALLVSELNVAGAFAEVSTWEMRQRGPSYTVELIRHVKERYGEDDLVFLAGEDSYRQMPEWREPQEIAQLCTIAVFGRSGSDSVPESCGVTFLPALLLDFDLPVSATMIRNHVASGQSIGHLVPPSISAYIESRSLYRS